MGMLSCVLECHTWLSCSKMFYHLSSGVLPAGVLDADLLHSEEEDSSVCINGLSHKAKAAGGFLHFSR